MPEVQIIRSQVIIVKDKSYNNYGDLLFNDSSGNNYKVSQNRKQYFENVIVPGMAVELNYAMSRFNKEYIYNASQVKDHLPEPIKPADVPGPPQEEIDAAKAKQAQKEATKDDRIARMNATTATAYMIGMGMAPMGDFGLIASQIERWNNFELNPTQLDANLKRILKQEEP